jgi:hypothetical protein
MKPHGTAAQAQGAGPARREWLSSTAVIASSRDRITSRQRNGIEQNTLAHGH